MKLPELHMLKTRVLRTFSVIHHTLGTLLPRGWGTVLRLAFRIAAEAMGIQSRGSPKIAGIYTKSNPATYTDGT